MVCIIDGSLARQHEANPLVGDAWRTQLAAADRLLVNRLDCCDRQEFEEWLVQFNHVARVEYETEETIEFSSTQPISSSASTKPYSPLRTASHGQWRTFSLSCRGLIDKEQLVALIQTYQDVLFRAKGFMFVEDTGDIELLQFTRGRLHWQPAPRAPQETRLVFIGIAGERFSAFEQAVKKLAK